MLVTTGDLDKAFLYHSFIQLFGFIILCNSMMIMVRLSATHSRAAVLFEILILRVKNVGWDLEKSRSRQYALANGLELYAFVCAVHQCIVNVCWGSSCSFLSPHRWQEALTVYPRTNKQNQKKKRKVDPPTQQVTTGPPILNCDFLSFF